MLKKFIFMIILALLAFAGCADEVAEEPAAEAPAATTADVYEHHEDFHFDRDAIEEVAQVAHRSDVFHTVIEFSHEGGFYEQGFVLHLSTYTMFADEAPPDELIEIRYETGGRRPTPYSAKYDGSGIIISACGSDILTGTIVTAVAFSESGERLSYFHTHSYFVSEDIFTRYQLPVISLVTDPANLFDAERGIYVNYEMRGVDWERTVHFELFEPDGELALSHLMGMRISGPSRDLEQKSLRLSARFSIDRSHRLIDYELFPGLTNSVDDEPLALLRRIILHNGGRDNSGALFRDALIHELASGLNLNVQAHRPCVVFINGEFWGVYNIRERLDQYYFHGHYFILPELLALLELSGGSTPEIQQGYEHDVAHYNRVWQFFRDNSMADGANYARAQEYICVASYIDFLAVNIYAGNLGWLENNNMFWRFRTEFDYGAPWYLDGRFRWALRNMDGAFGLGAPVYADTLGEILADNSWHTLIARRLFENYGFRAKFYARFRELMDTVFDADAVTARVREMQSARAAAVPEHSARFPSSLASAEQWEANIDALLDFVQNRRRYAEQHLQALFY